MNEKPLERLNYFNGQRLQAADFKLEQDYHMRVRRWLNRSLYTPGIASGLEVYAIKDSVKVKVLPGLAIDHLGREIILLEEQDFVVVGQAEGNGACKGPYLTIRYREEVIAQQDACCAVGGDSMNKVAWGGPARVLAEPVLELNAELPHESSGKIALACLTLAKGCASVETVDTGVRRYVGEGSAARVRQYALEGVRDLDEANPATIAFHVRGRQPTSITLYLRSEKFPSLAYTEMGQHAHNLHVTLQGGDGQHRHELGNHTTKPVSDHHHSVVAPFVSIENVVGTDFFLNLAKTFLTITLPGVFSTTETLLRWRLVASPVKRVEFKAVGATLATVTAPPETNSPGPFQVSGDGGHSHPYGSYDSVKAYTVSDDPVSAHTHAFAQRSADPAGVTDPTPPAYSARAGAPLTHVDSLQVAIDDVPVTDAVLTQIRNNSPQEEIWDKLGDGTSNHPLASSDLNGGSGAIRLDYLPGVAFGEGEHRIQLSVTGTGNGGRIHFNLYVE